MKLLRGLLGLCETTVRAAPVYPKWEVTFEIGNTKLHFLVEIIPYAIQLFERLIFVVDYSQKM